MLYTETMTLVVIGCMFAIFFALAFVSKRRFGTLGLALAAGALLANHVTVWLAAQITYFDIPTGSLSAKVAANSVLTLLPALLLLVSGPAYTNKKHAIFGALMFAIMATLLTLSPLASVLPSDELARTVLPFIATYSDGILTLAIGLSVADAWLTHNLPPRKKKHSE